MTYRVVAARYQRAHGRGESERVARSRSADACARVEVRAVGKTTNKRPGAAARVLRQVATTRKQLAMSCTDGGNGGCKHGRAVSASGLQLGDASTGRYG